MEDCCKVKDNKSECCKDKKEPKSKKLYIFMAIIAISLIASVFWYIGVSNYITGSSVFDSKEESSGIKATVYKSMGCGCCVNYVTYIGRKGFDVNVADVDDVEQIKDKYNIPGSMRSCHTTIIGDYFVEGHMPVEAINKLLSEKPDMAGIALPDMPSASPGMPGKKEGPFIIYAIDKSGNTKEFMRL